MGQGRDIETAQGSCLCGAIVFEVLGPFPRLYQCHCSLCRKQGGSVSNTGMIVAADKFHWLTGEALITQWMRTTGFRSHFCSRCGAPVPNPLRDTGTIWVPTGLLDGDTPLVINAQLFLGSKARWAEAGPGEFRFESAPDLPHLIEMLHGASAGSGDLVR